jgi:tellurite methyltransferase
MYRFILLAYRAEVWSGLLWGGMWKLTDDFTWSDFARVTKDNPPWPLLEKAVSLLGRTGYALDLGSGGGRDTRYLLASGWHVTAVDREPYAIALLAEHPHERLKAVQSTFEDFVYEHEKYDIVSAQFTLPFISRSRFNDVFDRIKGSIKAGGIFTGQFFGIHDEWNKPENDMTFLTRQEVDDLLSDMEVIEIREEERMGGTAAGTEKYWHVFHVIAQKEA